MADEVVRAQELITQIATQVTVINEVVKSMPARFDRIEREIDGLFEQINKSNTGHALLEARVSSLERDVSADRVRLAGEMATQSEEMVTQKEFAPFRYVGYLIATAVVLAIVGAILATVVRSTPENGNVPIMNGK